MSDNKRKLQSLAASRRDASDDEEDKPTTKKQALENA
jgi:hypothetical protein